MSSAIYPSLAGKRVLVTGGGSGIGSAIVEDFVRQQARVWFIDIIEDESRTLAQRLGAGQAQFRHCDLTDIQALSACIRDIAAQAGGLDILVNNAANDERHRIEDITPAYWDQRIAVNLRHLLFCSQAALPALKAAGGGAIINLGSISWHLALPELVLYETAKAGIEGMTRALARDLGRHDIRVNCVVPGAVRTPRQMRLWHKPEEEARMLEQQCLKQRVDPEHVAAMVSFLASDDARMCTAHNYFVDAGWR
ncbi:SDR family NAD(P)-dependent oxidoreductase [Verminephrobacter eiseniae]|uniref:D-xylose dehydrogenase n=1 Tax=Verminephrobacter eiseniae (strain EF01-2) TaxID=391735 RepID=A1WGG2_VEREI|nr:SDR family oxidoreductase [Verminephrobacter eiseniae]KAB7629228.1 SDR family oxidoreductase [Verminephrobacter sp. Larva24]ABM56719.1 D-xylose dehydrogenase [Verminephrobacter eiseniae EF01-2]MCW5233793.1 SDR family oxidoreductase [Verminephrobacter eiseniae]MCW5261918.1 SDR family oxidoreductase [Verminephrobacter eiseniae]MCW5287075.1 SDR family oxidoreductase [Verminephrobacter eiseniae]